MSPRIAPFGRVTSDLRGKAARGGAVAMTAEVVEFVLRVGSLAVLARLLIPEHFGLIAMVTTVTAVAERFKDLGLSIVTIQREHLTEQQVNTLFWANATLGLLIALLVAALSPAIAAFYDDGRLIPLTLAIATSFIWSGISVQHQALLRREMRFSTIAAVQISASLLSIIVAVAMALLDYGYWALVAREITRSLFLTTGTWLAFPWVPGRPSRHADIKSMLSFGGNVTAFNLVTFLAGGLDQILIGRYLGAYQLGEYRQGIQLVLGPIGQLIYPVHAVAEPAFSRLQKDPEEFRILYVRLLSALSMITMPLSIFLFLFAREVVLFILGPQWYDVIPVFRLLAIAAFLWPASSTQGIVMLVCGHSRRYLISGSLTALSLVVGVIVGLQWGITGVATAHIASTYVMLVALLHWNLRSTPVRPADFMCAIYRPAVASASAGLVVYSYKLESFLYTPITILLAGALSGGLIYTLVLLALPGGRADLLWLLRLARRAFFHR